MVEIATAAQLTVGLCAFAAPAFFEKLRRIDLQSPRQLEQRFHADIALAALDPADVVWVQPATLGQLLLGEIALLPQPPHLAPQRQQIGIVLHGAERCSGNRKAPQRISVIFSLDAWTHSGAYTHDQCDFS